MGDARAVDAEGGLVGDDRAWRLAGKSLKYVLADSWEAGTQNWTPAFLAEFRKRKGYDLTPWLPAFTGRVVGSLDESERALWDFRRVIADLIAENHYAVLHDLCAKHGMEFTAEAPGIGMPTIADELECKGRTDLPMGEFWLDGHNDSKEAATSAHIYGKRRASAEAFTAITRDAKWAKAPYDHKAIGGLNFCRGIKLFVFHRYAMQPWLDRAPGMTMGPWGTNFERTNTWWEQSRAWMQYISRCQALLQDGLFVADACYYYGEGAPNTIVPERAALTPPLPAGYDFDVCGAEVLLDLGTVREVAEVRLNGKNLGILWKPPYRVDLAGAVRPGANRLEVRITNLWPNRLIGDAALPVEKRFTYATFQPYKPGDPLLDSGLLGPVTLIAEKTVMPK